MRLQIRFPVEFSRAIKGMSYKVSTFIRFSLEAFLSNPAITIPKNYNDTNRTIITLPEAIYNRLYEFSKTKNLPMSKIIFMAVESQLTQLKQMEKDGDTFGHKMLKKADKKDDTEVPFFLNVKELMTWLRRRWRNREKAEVKFSLPENTIYKEFRFVTFLVEEKKGIKKDKVRWYNWTLITNYNSEQKGESDTELHRNAAEMIGRLQKPFKYFFIRGCSVKYFDPEKNQFHPATVQAVGDYTVGIIDDNKERLQIQKGYVVKDNKKD